jgi:hypothetical protein
MLLKRYSLHLLGLIALAMTFACSEGSDADDPGALPSEVSVKVGPAGAVVKAQGLSLDIPAGALDVDVMITAKSKGKDAGNSKATPTSDVYEFGPAGTKFKKDVKVSFDTDKPGDAEKSSVFFTKEDEPEMFEKLASTSDGKTVSAKVKHFSSGFAGVVSDVSPGLDGSVGSDEDAGSTPADSGASADDASTPVDEDAGPDNKIHITVVSKNLRGVNANQTWGAFQDGDGAWLPLPAPTSLGVYEFDIVAGSRYGVAFVCAKSDNSESDGSLVFAPLSRTSLSVIASDHCSPPPAVTSYQISGALNAPGDASGFTYGHAYGQQFNAAITSGQYFVYGLPTGQAVDVLMWATDTTETYRKAMFLRDQNHSANQALSVQIDKDGFLLGTATATVTNATTTTAISAKYTMRGATTGIPMERSQGGKPPTITLSYSTVPTGANAHRSTDRYIFSVKDSDPTAPRSIVRTSELAGAQSFSLPAPFEASHQLEASAPQLRPSVTFEDRPGATRYTFAWSYEPARNTFHTFSTEIDPGWLPAEASHSVAFPDLTGVTGFDATWLAPAGKQVDANAKVVVESKGANSQDVITSEQNATLPGT